MGDYIDNLNTLVRYFYDRRDGPRTSSGRVRTDMPIKVDGRDLLRYLGKLIDDGLIDSIGHPDQTVDGHTLTSHRITLNGIIFYESTRYTMENLRHGGNEPNNKTEIHQTNTGTIHGSMVQSSDARKKTVIKEVPAEVSSIRRIIIGLVIGVGTVLILLYVFGIKPI